MLDDSASLWTSNQEDVVHVAIADLRHRPAHQLTRVGIISPPFKNLLLRFEAYNVLRL